MIIEALTFILVIITAIYAYLTNRMAKASEASVEAIQNQSEAKCEDRTLLSHLSFDLTLSYYICE